MKLELCGIEYSIDGRPIVRGCDVIVGDGEMVGLVGPNGSGKSTLLRTAYRVLRPAAGAVQVNGDDVWRLPPREVARRIAVVTQESHGDFEFTVDEVVAMGRTPHKGAFDRNTARDEEIIADSLDRVGMTEMADRLFMTLSGGEKQRVLLARALAQEPRVLVLDEPTNHLDIRAQLDLLELVRGLRITTITALHDLNLAAAYCDRVYVMNGGAIVASGEPGDVFQPALLRDVFGVAAHLGTHELTGRRHIVFAPLGQASPVT